MFFTPSPTVNGAAYIPAAVAGRRMLLQAGAATIGSAALGAASTVVVTIDSTGRPVSITDSAGNPFLPIPFPSGGAPSVCVPAAVPTGSPVIVGGGSSVAMAFPGAVTAVAIK